MNWRALRNRLPKLRWGRTDAPSRRRRLWPWVVALLAVLGAYPVLVTAALWSGLVERLLRSEDLKVEIDNPAWTIWPGRVHLDGVRVYMNGETQFILSAHELRATFQLLPLIQRRVFVSSLYAEDVRYHMRLQLDEEDATSSRAAAFPPLEGLPGVATKSEEKAEQTEERESDWTVQVENIDVSVRDLWFLEYHYIGDGRLRGGFRIGPGELIVHSSVQDLGPGDLHFGEKQLIAKNFRGQVRAEVSKVDPEEHADTGFFEFVKANVELEADVRTLSHLQAYLNGLKVRGGAGRFEARVVMANGGLSRDSTIAFSTDEISLVGSGFGIKSDWKLDFEVGADAPDSAPAPSGQGQQRAPGKAAIQSAKPAAGPARPWLRSQSDVTYVSLARRDAPPFTIQVHGHEQVASLNSAKLGDETKLHSARLSFPKILSTDLDDLDTLVGKDPDLTTDAGTAVASLTLNLDDKGGLHGPLRARLEQARLSVNGIQLGADGRLNSNVSVHPASKSIWLGDLEIDLRDVSLRLGDERVEHWWMKLSSERLRATGIPPERLSADLSIVAKNAEPVLEGLAEKDKIPDIVPKLTNLGNLKVEAKVRKRGEVLDVMLDTLESRVVDFSGRVFLKGDERLIALLVGGKDVSLGIYKNGDETDYEVLAGSKWLNEKLGHFPRPVERVRGEKP